MAALALAACGDERSVIQVTTTTGAPPSAMASPSTGEAAATTSTSRVDGRSATAPASSPAPLRGHYVPVVLAEHPHDPTAWTQGLEWYDGRLLESTGRKGSSTLRLVDVESGLPIELVAIDDDLYAEGVTVVGDRAVQLTWRDETVLVTDLGDPGPALRPERLAGAYEGEGWGLCYDGAELVMSDGSDRLSYRDPESFELRRTVEVTLEGRPVDRLNELECVADQILANVWQTNTIVAIDAESGDVEASIDASSLVPVGYGDSRDAVLNGIAFNPETGTFWLTGKLWPVLYEVTLAPG